MDSGVIADQFVEPATCALCQRALSPENEAIGDFITANMCGDCKFLYLEDLGTPTRDSYRRRPSRRRRARYSSSESVEVEDIFSQQFSHMINQVRQNQSPGSGLEDPPVGGDSPARVSHRTSSRTTPSGSRRWRRVLSDTESDGFDNADSLYGENESNISFGRFRVSRDVSDVISFSAYGGDSDASVDLQGFLDTETIIQPIDGSVFDSDTDIDPMHAGLNPWNSDDPEEDDDDDDEEEDEEDDEWEEVDSVENMVESAEAISQPRNPLILSSGRRNRPVNWHQRRHITEVDDPLRWGMRGRNSHDILSNFDDSDMMPYVTNSGDYLDAVGFEELLEHLAEADSLRRGAPPAAVSFVNKLPLIHISKEHDKHDDLACAICKDLLTIGTEVNQLPCFHLYHPSCILPWLGTRNSCPLCRYELPTDDRDYEEGKRNAGGRVEIHVRQQNAREDRSIGVPNRAEEDEDNAFSETRVGPRFQAGREPDSNTSGGVNSPGRWFLFAAAPIVSLVGIVLVLWLGTPTGQGNFADQAQRHGHVAGALPHHRQNRSRRWWSLF
ncbi:uncharacterized protein LOC126799654 [Argentina anserina]|uniref:uncharacterized protein LOC126799654 n=1 Tax=Argentina anserina TaxID=57926 RepID=UPI00217628AC|nr:uncharacterized protein LOC126799654 [Potentilla anserina]XP_050382853.1 uncharacterized protein LOC126799654 [Potentilla anserina]